MKTSLALLFACLLCLGQSKRFMMRPNNSQENNGCKPSEACLLYGGYCIDNNDKESCPGRLFSRECRSSQCSCCVDGAITTNECNTGENDCPSNSVCQDKETGYDCVCDEGFAICGDVDECASNPCSGNYVCINNFGSYSCVCPDGFEETISGCEDINECDVSGGVCGDFSSCVNIPGSFECVCNAGFTDVDGTCQDIDECIDSESCPALNDCVNTPGSFECICIEGYEINLSSESCEDIDECADPYFCGAAIGQCVNTDGSYECNCIAGYAFTDGVCQDINECDTDPCPDNNVCENSDGSYSCFCPVGFVIENGNCINFDDCASNPCEGNEECTDLVNNYACDCPNYICAYPALCPGTSVYIPGIGCIIKTVGPLNYEEAKKRCKTEHKGLVYADTQAVIDQIGSAVVTSDYGIAWIDSASVSEATCPVLVVIKSKYFLSQMPCGAAPEIDYAICLTFGEVTE